MWCRVKLSLACTNMYAACLLGKGQAVDRWEGNNTCPLYAALYSTLLWSAFCISTLENHAIGFYHDSF